MNVGDYRGGEVCGGTGTELRGEEWNGEDGRGQYTLVGADHPDFVRILKQGRAAQDAAIKKPEAYNEETRELLAWYDDELKTRHGRNGASTSTTAEA